MHLKAQVVVALPALPPCSSKTWRQCVNCLCSSSNKLLPMLLLMLQLLLQLLLQTDKP